MENRSLGKNGELDGPLKRAFPRVFITLAASLLLGCSGGSDKAPQNAAVKPAAGAAFVHSGPGDPAAGKLIYERYCHFCHGTKGMGDGPVGIAITPHPADFVNDAKRMAKTDEELFKSITEGVHRAIGGEEMAMPRWQDILSEKERWDVLAYIRQLGQAGKKADNVNK